MTNSSLPRRITLLSVALVMVFAVGCSSSSSSKSAEAKYCESWQKVAESFTELNGIAINQNGIDGLKTALTDITASAKQLADSADAMLEPKVAALQSALGDLGSALTSPSTDYFDKIEKASNAVDSAWNDLVNAAKTSCPDVKASAV